MKVVYPNKNYWLLECALVALLFGFYIYITSRSQNLLMFTWFEAIGIDSVVFFIRENFRISFPIWIVNSFPFALWVLSLGLVLVKIWQDKLTFAVKLFILSTVTLAGLGVEVLQGFNLVRGTFDIVDVVFLIIPIIVIGKVLKIYSYEKD